MVIHDLQDLRLLQTPDGLGLFVVVHEDDPLAAGTQQMEPGQGAHHTLLIVQDGVGAEAAFQHGVLHVVDEVVQVEIHQILALADALDGQGVADEAHGLVGVVGRGDDARLRVHLQKLPLHLCLADDDAVDVQLQRPADHIRLVAADDDAVGVGEHQVLPSGGQRHGDLTGDHFPKLHILVEDLALQHGQQVVDRHLSHLGIADGGHIVVGHVAGGEHTVQGTILVGHGDDGDLVGLHGLPGPGNGGRGGEGGRRVVIQVPHLGAQIADELRCLEAEPVQHRLGLVADLAQPGGFVVTVAQGVFQRRVRHGGHDGVRVRIAVAGDVNCIHTLCFSFNRVLNKLIMLPRRRFVNGCRRPAPARNRLPFSGTRKNFFRLPSQRIKSSLGAWVRFTQPSSVRAITSSMRTPSRPGR